MLFRSQLPYRARIFPVGIEQGTAAHKETAGNGRQQDWLSAFFQGGLAVAPQVFRIGRIRIRVPLVILFIVVSELDEQQVAGGKPLLHGGPEAFLPERPGASAGEGVVFDFHAFFYVLRQGPAPAPERRLVILHGGIADDPDGRHGKSPVLSYQFCRTCFRSMTQTWPTPFASGLEKRI